MKLSFLLLSLLALAASTAGCLDLAGPDDDPGAIDDPAIVASTQGLDEDLAPDMLEVQLPETIERTAGHRLVATDANLHLFRHGCFASTALDWSCASGLDGRHAHLAVRRRTGANHTEVADNHGYYWGECVSLVKSATKSNVVTSEWRPGANVFDGLAAGTAIATFPGGHYYGHTAILLGYVKRDGKIAGIRIADQNWGAREVKRHIIWRSGSGVADADSYNAVVVP